MTNQTFGDKWREIKVNQAAVDERSLFVEPGERPRTQRQLNLYYYFLFIERILKQTRAQKVLEIGCGRGTIASYLAKYLGLRLTLLDNEPSAIDLARDNFRQLELSAEFVVSDARATPFPDSSFDAVVSIGLAEHFESTEVLKLFAEQYRLLRPGGVMISLNIPKKISIQSLNTIMRFFKKIFGRHQDNIKKDYYRNDLSATDFAQLAERVGLSRVKTVYVCPFPIWVPVSPRFDRFITALRRAHLRLRSLFMSYPFKTNPLVAQAHFLVGYKSFS